MTAFHNTLFPLPLAFGSSGGPQRQTDIVTLANGAEQRNTSRSQSRRRYNAGAGIKSLDDVHRLIAFFEARRGSLHSFLFKDGLDHKSCKPSMTPSAVDQFIGTGDGSRTEFPVFKTYGDEAATWSRRIRHLRGPSVKVAIDGAEINAFVLDDGGNLVFDIPPLPDAQVTAGYEFYVPVRFENNGLDLTLEAFGAGEIASVPLIEVLDYA